MQSNLPPWIIEITNSVFLIQLICYFCFVYWYFHTFWNKDRLIKLLSFFFFEIIASLLGFFFLNLFAGAIFPVKIQFSSCLISSLDLRLVYSAAKTAWLGLLIQNFPFPVSTQAGNLGSVEQPYSWAAWYTNVFSFSSYSCKTLSPHARPPSQKLYEFK